MGIAQVRKAVVAGVTAGIGAAVVAYPDGFTGQEIGTIAAAVVVAALAVFGVANAPADR
jgi:hypothetical protein